MRGRVTQVGSLSALAGTGHPAMAYQILRFLQRMQAANGTWAAMYLPGGSGPLRDGRPAELDADGWVPWAVWSWDTDPAAKTWQQAMAGAGAAVADGHRAADAAAQSLTGDGLPGPAMDTGRTRSRSRSAPPPRCWPACVPPPTWPPTSAVLSAPATAAAGAAAAARLRSRDHGRVRPGRLPAHASVRIGRRRGHRLSRAAVRRTRPWGTAGRQLSTADAHPA